jgi:ubiquitin-protein ligase
VRARRIQSEWKLLQELEAQNPRGLEVLERGVGPLGEFFRIRLYQTASPIKATDGIKLKESHQIEFSFPRFFPAVPIEAILQVPVFHPNVDPDNGFVCLWTRTSPGDTIIEATIRIQLVIAWDLVNLAPDHVMQPDAVDWYHNEGRSIGLPCDFQSLIPPHLFYGFRHSHESAPECRRRRLSC